MKILISEDTDIKFETIFNTLLKYNNKIEIERTTSINETVRTLLDSDFDALILDMQLPQFKKEPFDIVKKGGLEILQYLEKNNKTIPTIILSTGNNIREILDLNVFGYDFENIKTSTFYFDSTCWENDLRSFLSSI
jgi:CheY-like chemotaxis protein